MRAPSRRGLCRRRQARPPTGADQRSGRSETDPIALAPSFDTAPGGRAGGRRPSDLAAGCRRFGFELAVAVRDEDLPRDAVRIVDPDLVLAGVAASRVHLVEGGKPFLLQPQLGGQDVVGAGDLDARVVERAQLLAFA